MATDAVFIKRFEDILKAEQETAYAYNNICDNYIKKFGIDSISERLHAIYLVELQHISLAEKLMKLISP